VQGQLVPRHEPGQWGLGIVGERAQVGVALGLIDDDREPEHAHVVAQLRLEAHDLLPRLLVRVAIDDALHQSDGGDRQSVFGHGDSKRGLPWRARVTCGIRTRRPLPRNRSRGPQPELLRP